MDIGEIHCGRSRCYAVGATAGAAGSPIAGQVFFHWILGNTVSDLDYFLHLSRRPGRKWPNRRRRLVDWTDAWRDEWWVARRRFWRGLRRFFRRRRIWGIRRRQQRRRRGFRELVVS